MELVGIISTKIDRFLLAINVIIQLSGITVFIIKLSIMAFVFRAQRKGEEAKQKFGVGPGAYEHQVQRQNKIPKAYVPFGSMETRNKELNLSAANWPGPGSYNLTDNHNGEKIVVSSETEDIKILEISRPNPVFKSSSLRFSEIKEEDVDPGPGEYNVAKGIASRPKMLSTNTNSGSQKPKIIQHLISINKYQSIPSIPSSVHAYGYNENDNNELELNEPPIEVYKGEKEDLVGPGHYNVTQQGRAKGISCWSQAREKRLDENKPSLGVGPGAYDIKFVQSLHNYKPSAGFASKTLRAMDQRKGAIINDKKRKMQQKIVQDQGKMQSQTESRISSEKAPPSTQIDDSDSDEYEYIEDTTPGPGSYLEISEVKKFHKRLRPGVPSFGTGTKRFSNSTHQAVKEVGPGSYDPKFNYDKKIKHNREKITLKDTDRFPELINKKRIDEPGPGNYEPRNTLEDKLIYKIQRGYRGQFGSTDVRSKEPQTDEQPGPGQYDVRPYEQEKQALSVFKSTTKRKGISNISNSAAPGSYNINQYDISTRVIKQEEYDPDLVIKRPGFNVGEKRFKEISKQEDEFEDDDIIKQIQEKYREEKKLKQLKPSAVFKNNEPRLCQSKKEIPGPGSYYDGEDDRWNKRTYNILFADI